jgi:hypothetical protein
MCLRYLFHKTKLATRQFHAFNDFGGPIYGILALSSDKVPPLNVLIKHDIQGVLQKGFCLMYHGRASSHRKFKPLRRFWTDITTSREPVVYTSPDGRPSHRKIPPYGRDLRPAGTRFLRRTAKSRPTGVIYALQARVSSVAPQNPALRA